MAFAVVQTAVNALAGASATLTATFSSPVGSGNCVVGLWGYGGPTSLFTNVTDNTSAVYNNGDVVSNLSATFALGSFFLGNITNGPTAVTMNLNNTPSQITVVIAEISGVLAASNPGDGHISNGQNTAGTGANAIVSTNVTTTTNGDCIFGVYGGTSGQLIGTAGTGFTAAGTGSQTGFSPTMLMEILTQSTAGAIQTTFTQASQDGETVCFLIALKAAAAPPPTVVRMGAISL